MNEQQQDAVIPPTVDAQKVLDSLPGLTGGIDKYLKDVAGKPVGFVLLAFVGDQALFVTNGDRDGALTNVCAFAATVAKTADVPAAS